jgi:hypothetical protein
LSALFIVTCAGNTTVMDPKNWTPEKGKSTIAKKESRWANLIEPIHRNSNSG